MEVLGTQIWVERHDTPERVEQLFKTAADTGIGWVRLFLMWPWMEAVPGKWEFEPFDAAFDAAARHGIKIKATLTANSGPWHIGTPMALHTLSGFLAENQREPMRKYVRECVTRYAKHPALGQWILWNEPAESGTRGEIGLAFWRDWLRRNYSDIEQLNERWLTGFTQFDEIPFPEEIAHPLHRRLHWLSYRPSLDDAKCRAEWLVDQIAWISAIVREIDPVTPTCVNPAGALGNLAAAGLDLRAIAAGVDVLGASFHPAWSFTFADRYDYPALIATGVRQLAGVPGKHRVEVTEVQTGNTTESSIRPNNVTPGEIARFHLASLAAGAESVTGWCFNIRQQDNEAGDWALLDDGDQPSPRSEMLREVGQRFRAAVEKTGAWTSAQARAVVLSSPDSQAIEMIAGRDGYMNNAGRRANDGCQGAAILAVRLMRLGVSTTITKPAHAPSVVGASGLIVASHLTSWDRAEMKAILDCVDRGATLLVDGVSGRRDHDAALHQPWPGELSTTLGIESAGLETRFEGWPWHVGTFNAGVSVLTRIVIKRADPEWHAWADARFDDGEPCIYERPHGRGRVVLFRGTLGASTLDQAHCPGIEWLLQELSPGDTTRVVSGSRFAVSIPVSTTKGRLVAVLAPELTVRSGQPLRIRATTPIGWTDLWTGESISPGIDGEFTTPANDGVAILWQSEGTPY